MKQFKIINNIVGWVAFAIAAFTYCSTVEPTASFWDCPEFITTAFKLEVGHPPGAPFFMLTGNFFSLFTSDPTKVALMINIMNALLSAFCILFLFWSVTHLARKLIVKSDAEISLSQTILIMACGLTGALAYAWSDTFWFSAVEGEVYAYSSMFTALVFWLMLKWEDHADEPGSDRWIILIFYLTGLSIGVHLLNLLCLPAICLVYYYKKHPQANAWGSVVALGISFVLVAAVLYGLVPGIVKVGGWFEWFCVNDLGLPFNSGMIIYLLILVGTVLSAIWATTRENRVLTTALYTASVALLGIPFFGHGAMSIVLGVVILMGIVGALMIVRDGKHLISRRFLNTSLLCMLMMMIGYSSYTLILVRSVQNTPMDQNSPEDIFTLGSYLNREQYGDSPLFYGHAFTSQPISISKEDHIQRVEKTTEGEPDAYESVEINGSYVYAGAEKMFFPRMHDSRFADFYNSWNGGIDYKTFIFTIDQNGQTYNDIPGRMPSQYDNFRFFLSYQVGYMYWRYFMWNFAGRQNDIQGLRGRGDLEYGNWITGIPFIDNAMLGDQSKLPDELKENKGHNVFYCMPLILGLLGMFWQAYRGRKGAQQFWVVFFLFFMTGLAIVVYLNQTPSQPRERDYAYAGSFYAFCIWIGLGVAALAAAAQRALTACKVPEQRVALASSLVALVVGLIVPLQMVSQTWDDHDRSGRYTCRDFGANYLNSLPEKGNPIIFTNGDNDTFPLWYGQEVEGIRTDARVCNLSYLQTDWYTDQMRRPAYDSPGLPITWSRAEYVDNHGRDVVYVKDSKDFLDAYKEKTGKDPYELKFILDNFVRNYTQFGWEQPVIPTDSIVMTVDSAAVRRSGMKIPEGQEIPGKMVISIAGKRYLSKSEIMVYEMLANHNWTRPMFMSITLGRENEACLSRYLQLEGLCSRITPFYQSADACDTQRMYDNMMHRFKFGNLSQKGLYIDETTSRMCFTHRSMFVTLARQLYDEGQYKKALEVLYRCEKEIPSYNVPYSPMSLGYDPISGQFTMPMLFHLMGKDKDAERILLEVAKSSQQYLQWFESLDWEMLNSGSYLAKCQKYYQYLAAATEGLHACKSSQYAKYNKYFENIENTNVGKALIRDMERRYQEQNAQFGGETDYVDYAEE